MHPSALCVIAAVCASSVLAINRQDPFTTIHKHRRRHHGKQLYQAYTTPTPTTTTSTSTATSTATISPTSGWVPFSFGPAGTNASTIFRIENVVPELFRLIDVLCSGDQFAVYDNGVFIGNSTIPINDDCQTFALTAQEATTSTNFSVFNSTLLPGTHSIEIGVLVSPSGGGTAAVSVESYADICNHTAQGLVVLDTPFTFANAATACGVYNLTLADINIYNFANATQLVYDCVGPFTAAYIGSYWQNNYGDSCLALYTGNDAPGGAISVPRTCNTTLPVMCQIEPTYRSLLTGTV